MFRFATMFRVLAALAFLGLAAGLAHAQQAPMVGIDPIRATLDQIEAQARRGTIGMNALTELAERISPLRDDLRDKLADLEPRLADVDGRLKALGAPPAAGATEDAAIAAERARLTQQRNELDSAIKQMQLLQARATQLTATLTDRRRAAYAETMFRKSPNVLDPYFWHDVAMALPDYGERLAKLVQDWISYARDQGGPARMTSAAIALAGLLIIAIGFIRWWRRRAFIARIGDRYGMALASLAVFLRRALTAPIAVFVVLELLDQFQLIPDDYERLVSGLIFGTAMAALARAAATGVLAPDDARRRQVKFDDVSAQWLSAHLVGGGRLFGAFLILRAVHRTIGAPEAIDTALRMLFALAVAATLVHLLVRERDDEEEPRRIPGMRLLAWLVVAVIVGALLAGYARFAAFVAGRVVFTLSLVATLYLLLIVTDAAINRTMSPDSSGGRKLARQIGIDPRRLGLFGKLASGIVRALFVLIVIALAVGRWEVAAGDLLEAIKSFSFGIRIGDFTISFGAVFGAVALFGIIAGLTRLLQRWLEAEVMPHTAIEPSLRMSIVTIIGYVGFIIAVIVALGEIGIDPQKIALVAGALSVGIGFGLQSIVSNFVSGLILLAERPIRVGDQIVVKGDEGFVRRISVRATEIETFDKASVIIPNSELITGVVKNWTHANTLGRINIKVTTGYDEDAEKVIALLKGCVAEHPSVLKQPAPAVQLTEFGSALTFEVFCIVQNLADRGAIKSDLHLAILRKFRDAGIALAPPQDVRLVGGAEQASSAKA
jgi:potassium-dependent mechanosensitive channel